MVVQTQAPGLSGLLDDLAAESDDLDGVVAGLAEPEWSAATPAPGWTIAHQIAHLAWTDDRALVSTTDPERFDAELVNAAANPEGFVDDAAEHGAQRPSGELLAQWRSGRRSLAEALAAVPQGTRLPWFGPPMSVASMVTARLMETWAHGQDIVDALRQTRVPTARLRHVAWIGVRTRDFAYLVRDLTPPPAPFRVQLEAPGGETWTWGPDDAQQNVTGPALDFCLLVTQRRHLDDTALQASGGDAAHWLQIAQAFAGPPGAGRRAGEFS